MHVALALAAFFSLEAPPTPAFLIKQRSTTIDAKVRASWEKSGARVEWYGHDETGNREDTDDMSDGISRIRAYGVDGKPLDKPELAKRLAKPSRVVVFYTDPPDAYYLQFLKEGAVVFVLQRDTFEQEANDTGESLHRHI